MAFFGFGHFICGYSDLGLASRIRPLRFSEELYDLQSQQASIISVYDIPSADPEDLLDDILPICESDEDRENLLIRKASQYATWLRRGNRFQTLCADDHLPLVHTYVRTILANPNEDSWRPALPIDFYQNMATRFGNRFGARTWYRPFGLTDRGGPNPRRSTQSELIVFASDHDRRYKEMREVILDEIFYGLKLFETRRSHHQNSSVLGGEFHIFANNPNVTISVGAAPETKPSTTFRQRNLKRGLPDDDLEVQESVDALDEPLTKRQRIKSTGDLTNAQIPASSSSGTLRGIEPIHHHGPLILSDPPSLTGWQFRQ